MSENTGGKFGKWLRETPSPKTPKEPPQNESVADGLARCKAQEEKDKKDRRRT